MESDPTYSMPVTLPPDKLSFANDGIPLSEAFNDLYHSVDGGLAQARAVFLEGNRVAERWRGRDSFTILETGFGLGINFLAAWDALRADANRPRRLHA